MFIYTLRRRAHMRSIRLAIHRDGSLVVSAAKSVSQKRIEKLLEQKRDWIEKHQIKMKNRPRLIPVGSTAEYHGYKNEALTLAQERIEYFSTLYQVKPVSISIRNPRTRWGSCSRKGRITFSYRLVFLPPDVRDYLIVHELCHLKEFNHSPRFWKLVEGTIPNHKRLRQFLKAS